jgi:DNA-binding transcriptional MerR regulator
MVDLTEGNGAMLSIGRFAQIACVSARTLRYYESVGLIRASSRAANQYRLYDQSQLERVNRIRGLQQLGFSLDEIKNILEVPNHELTLELKKKLSEVDAQIAQLEQRRAQLKSLLSVSHKIDCQQSVNSDERKQYMDAVRAEIIEGLRSKLGDINNAQLEFLDRDLCWIREPDRRALILAIQQCANFAKEHQLELGPGRGVSSASMALFGLGFSAIDPSQCGLIPERLTDHPGEIHIDVQFERGQNFVDFCREVSKSLPFGQIQAFKMPLIDIIQSVHRRIGSPIDYRNIDENSDTVLRFFRSGEIEKIFGFDEAGTLVSKYESLLPEYAGLKKLKAFLRSQSISSFRDVLNIFALWRPSSNESIDRINAYRKAKSEPFTYVFLTEKLRQTLEPNFGRVIYHEDIVLILNEYTGWGFARCNRLRRRLRVEPDSAHTDLEEFKQLAPPEVVDLVLTENPHTFCRPHTVAFGQFIKQTAVLKALHRDLYEAEIADWERRHAFKWNDIGIRIEGVSLLQN